MGRMEGKIAVVTGVGSGIGRAIATMFAKEGAKIVGADFNPAEGQKTIDAIKAAGGEAVFVEVNVRKKEDIDKLYDVTMQTYGTVTTIANCAGVLVHKPFLEHDDKDYDFISETNMRGYIWIMQKFLPEMTKVNSHGKNAIVNIASISSIKPETYAYYYGAFKAGIDLMTRNLTREFSPLGVRLNVICPGPVTTNMTPPRTCWRTPRSRRICARTSAPSAVWASPRTSPMPPPICAPTRRPGLPVLTSSSTAAPA